MTRSVQHAREARPFVVEVAHTADAGFEVRAPTLAALLERAALALLDLMADTDGVQPCGVRSLAVRGDGLPDVLHAFLSAVVLQVQVDRFLGCAVAVGTADARGASAEVLGETFDPHRHRLHAEVKAVTWHQLAIAPRDGGWWARVIVDV